MKLPNLIVGTFIGTVLLAHGIFFSVAAQDTIEEARREKIRLEKEIRAIDARISSTDSLMLREAERFTLLQQRLTDGIAQKKTDIDTLNRKLEDLDTEIRRVSGAVERQRAGQRAVEKRREYISAQLVAQCRNLAEEIHRSLPWNREERIARVNALRNDLESGSARIEDGFSRLRSLLDEETAFGDEVVLATRTVPRNDGSTVSARVLRIGNVWMAYVDASEQMYGVLHRENDTTFIWIEDLDFAQREQIRTAIRVKESKKAPQIVTLPVKAAPYRREEN